MIDRDLTGSPPFRLALAALALSTVVVLWTVVRTVRLDPVVESPPPTFLSASDLAARAPRLNVDVRAAVQKDLFSPDRTAPAERYRVPGEDPPPEAVVVEAPKPVVLGTAVGATGRSFATCQLGDGPPIIVRVGDRIGEYTVKTIARGMVVFTSAKGTPLEVPALKPRN